MANTTIMKHAAADDLRILEDQCVFLRSVYCHYKILFECSTAHERDRMSRIAHIFFSDLNHVLIEYVVLQVCKITDPARDARGNDNHTIAFLLGHYDFDKDPVTWRRLNELHEKLLGFRAKLQLARNKLISHSDRQAIRAGVALGAATEDEWSQFWRNLRDILCLLHEEIFGHRFRIDGVAQLSDAHGLLKALKHGDCFDRLLSGDDPEVSRVCADLALG